MLSKCRAIVIKKVDYAETSVVLTCYTDAYGTQTYLVNSVRSGKGSIKPSHLLPLTLLEIEAYHQQNKNMQRIKELRCAPLLHSIHFDVIKSAIGIFVAEIIYKTIKAENQSDEALFAFLFNAIQVLDLQTQSANFPNYFLIQLSRYLGFLPKGIYTEETNSFDWAEGKFGKYDALYPAMVEPDTSKLISDLLQSDSNSFPNIAMKREQRITVLECLIQFYRQHTDALHEVKSYKVLAEVLG